MGHLMFYLAVVAACLLWSATCVAAAARTDRTWLRRLLVAVGLLVPVLFLLPWVVLTGYLAFGMKLRVNWFAPTVIVLVAVIVGGLWIRAAGFTRRPIDGGFVAGAWPVVALATGFVLAKACAFGTLLFIDNAVAAESRALRVEAAQIMAATMPPAPMADDDAAPLYLRVLGPLKAEWESGDSTAPIKGPLDTDITAPEVAATLSRLAATLDILRRAADKPDCRFVRDWSRIPIDMPLEEEQAMPQAARLLALAARREAADGDTAAALRDIVRLHRMGMHVAAEPVLVSGLLGQVSDRYALEALVRVLPTLREQDLPLLDDVAVREFLATPISLQRQFLGEDAFGLVALADLGDATRGVTVTALLDQVYAEPKESSYDGLLSLFYRCFLLPAEEAGYRRTMRKHHALFASLLPGGSLYEARKQAEGIENPVRDRSEGVCASFLTPAIGPALAAQARAQALHAAAEVLVAATRARLQSGSLPDSAADLVPEQLPALPIDPFTKEELLRSKTTDSEWIVYSVGPDGEDDGGPVPLDADDVEGNDDVGLRMAVSR